LSKFSSYKIELYSYSNDKYLHNKHIDMQRKKKAIFFGFFSIKIHLYHINYLNLNLFTFTQQLLIKLY